MAESTRGFVGRGHAARDSARTLVEVARLEMVLAQTFPGASGRLAYLAEGHMLAAGDIVEVLACRVRHK